MNKEKMIEFCREKIIMANNPECKTYEEALEKEAENDLCYIKEYEDSEPRLTAVLEEQCRYECNKPFYEKFQILGLPLTLERVLVGLVNKWQNIQYHLKQDNIQYKTPKYEYNNLLEKFFIHTMNNYGITQYINWQPNKTLEEQSDETIKAIAEILGYKE